MPAWFRKAGDCFVPMDDEALAAARRVPEGSKVKLRIESEDKKPRRSENQNRYLWGVCYKNLCEVLPGWRADDVHEYMLGEWAGWETLEGMGRKRLRPVRRSSKLNKQEFTDFVAFIHQKAAEHGCHIPDPEL